MTTNTSVAVDNEAIGASSTESPPASPLRIWPAAVMLALFWAFHFVQYSIGMTNFSRFMSRLAAHGLLLVLFLGWWLTRRQVSRGDRWLAVGVVILGSVGTLQIADPTIGIWAILLSALPLLFTGWTVWLWVSRNASTDARRIGLCATIVFILGYFSLVRWDGLDGFQRDKISWRWSATSEELFLASKGSPDVDGAEAAPRPAAASAWTLQPGDWAEFRGPDRDSKIHGVTLAADLNNSPPKSLWRERVGPGWSSMIVVDGHLVTQEQRGELEAVVCYDAASGREIWAHEDTVRFDEALAGPGPRGTPTFFDGRIYALGGKGKLNCLDAATGELRWSKETASEAAAQVPQWGYSVSPLIVDGWVVTFAGGESDKSVLAYNAATGETVWSQAGGKESYSSPMLATLDGVRQIVMHDIGGLRGIDAADGSTLWERPTDNAFAIPMLQPHVVGPNRLLISVEPGLSLLEIERKEGDWAVADRWTVNRFKPSFNDFVVYEGQIYGLDDGILCCIDLETGDRLWKKGRYGHGQLLLLVDAGQLLILGETGEVVLVAANPERLDELGRFQAIEGKTWNHPVIARDRLYVRNGEEMAGYQMQLLDKPSPARLADR